jgi:hypothetical protein
MIDIGRIAPPNAFPPNSKVALDAFSNKNTDKNDEKAKRKEIDLINIELMRLNSSLLKEIENSLNNKGIKEFENIIMKADKESDNEKYPCCNEPPKVCSIHLFKKLIGNPIIAIKNSGPEYL